VRDAPASREYATRTDTDCPLPSDADSDAVCCSVFTVSRALLTEQDVPGAGSVFTDVPGAGSVFTDVPGAGSVFTDVLDVVVCGLASLSSRFNRQACSYGGEMGLWVGSWYTYFCSLDSWSG
jgi:hypothetical protein